MSRGSRPITLGACVLASACAREPVDAVCPALGPGDLRISELRGPRDGDSAQDREWIEVENATGAEVEIEGLTVDLLAVDGGVHLRLFVRDSLVIAGGARVVLGRFDDATRPEHVDHGLAAWNEDLPSSGAVTLLACGTMIDRVVYDGIPTMGTYARSGDVWCADTTPSGTPGAENPPCP